MKSSVGDLCWSHSRFTTISCNLYIVSEFLPIVPQFRESVSSTDIFVEIEGKYLKKTPYEQLFSRDSLMPLIFMNSWGVCDQCWNLCLAIWLICQWYVGISWIATDSRILLWRCNLFFCTVWLDYGLWNLGFDNCLNQPVEIGQMHFWSGTVLKGRQYSAALKETMEWHSQYAAGNMVLVL